VRNEKEEQQGAKLEGAPKRNYEILTVKKLEEDSEKGVFGQLSSFRIWHYIFF
jgi:hypothetical protein